MGNFVTVFYNIFCTNNRTFMSFFKTQDTKLKTVIICNTGCPMFKIVHIAFISLKKPCICRSVGSKYKFIIKYHRNITLDHPHAIYPYSTIIKYSCSKHMMQLSLWFYTFIQYCNRLERKSTDTGIIQQNLKTNSQQTQKKTFT